MAQEEEKCRGIEQAAGETGINAAVTIDRADSIAEMYRSELEIERVAQEVQNSELNELKNK